jgi:hypothetical protein
MTRQLVKRWGCCRRRPSHAPTVHAFFEVLAQGINKRQMIRALRLLFGLRSPFCKRWGCDAVRGFGPGRETGPDWICLDPDCGWYQS